MTPSALKQHSENDRKVIATLGAALAGTGPPLIITSGTGLVQSKAGQPVTETDNHATSAVFARAAAEEAAEALAAQGGNVMVMRLPQVHDKRRQGRIRWHIQIAPRFHPGARWDPAMRSSQSPSGARSAGVSAVRTGSAARKVTAAAAGPRDGGGAQLGGDHVGDGVRVLDQGSGRQCRVGNCSATPIKRGARGRW